jgi:cell division protein ZapA
MAMIDVEIASRRYSIACRDGEETHLRSVAELIDIKARQAAEALGSLSEVRQLLFASLLLADELSEHRAGNPPTHADEDPRIGHALERLAERIERLAQRLESERP